MPRSEVAVEVLALDPLPSDPSSLVSQPLGSMFSSDGPEKGHARHSPASSAFRTPRSCSTNLGRSSAAVVRRISRSIDQ
jgi:hypothetical protein